MLQTVGVMLHLAQQPFGLWNRESDCKPSSAHAQMTVRGLGS